MNKKVCIILVGGPCSGKSSTGKLTAKKLNAEYISSGDIARKMAEQSDIIKNSLDHGALAPENKMRKSISNELKRCFIEQDKNIVILDGFPRFGRQAEWLRDELPPTIKTHYVMIHAPSCVMRTRANNRGRSDDNSFEERLDYYRRVTYNELYGYLDTIINTEFLTTEECSMLLTEFIKEVM